MSEEPKQEEMKSEEEEEPAGLERAPEGEAKVDQRASNRALAPITPVKVEKFLGLQQFMTMSMLTDRIDLGSIQIGTLSNGVFEKTEMDSEKSFSTPSPSKFCMKRYHSSML
jgi:hypothetical protein